MGDLLPAAAGHVRPRNLRRERRFRRRRRPVPERQRHLPRCRRRPGGVGAAEPQRRHRRDAAQQRHSRFRRTSPPPSRVCRPIGEQYIDLVPPGNPATTQAAQRFPDRPAATPAIGQDVADLLKRADTLVNSLGDTRLRELLHETFIAANGSGPELARLLESARLLVDEANANYPQVSQLIDQAGPFLQAQIRAGADIKSLADGLARFTSEVRQADPQLRATRWPPPRARPTRPTPRSPASAPPSRRWRPTWPTSAGSVSSITSRSSSCWWSSRRCSPRSPPPPAACRRTRAPSWTSSSTSTTRRRAAPDSCPRR